MCVKGLFWALQAYSVYSGFIWTVVRFVFVLTWLIPLLIAVLARRFSKQVIHGIHRLASPAPWCQTLFVSKAKLHVQQLGRLPQGLSLLSKLMLLTLSLERNFHPVGALSAPMWVA